MCFGVWLFWFGCLWLGFAVLRVVNNVVVYVNYGCSLLYLDVLALLLLGFGSMVALLGWLIYIAVGWGFFYCCVGWVGAVCWRFACCVVAMRVYFDLMWGLVVMVFVLYVVTCLVVIGVVFGWFDLRLWCVVFMICLLCWLLMCCVFVLLCVSWVTLIAY